MDLVVDASVLIAVLVSEPERERLIQLTKNADLVAPGSVHWEVGNALAAMMKRNRIDLGQVQAALKAYERIPIRYRDIDLDSAMQIASDHGLHAYDAYVVACARERGCALITLDGTLGRAAKQARVSVVEV